MLKLPVCPYCKAIYRYGDVRKKTYNKTIKCHNCERSFRVSYKKGRAAILSAAAVFLVVINVLMFNFIKGITLLGCLIVAIIFVSIAVLLFPFTVRYKKIDGEEEKTKPDSNEKSQKARERKKQTKK